MKQFNTTLNGYDKTEVNAFVNEVTREYENVLDKLKSREIELKALKDRLEYYKNLESTLNTAVLVAEDSSNQIKKIAKEEAERQAKDYLDRHKTEVEIEIDRKSLFEVKKSIYNLGQLKFVSLLQLATLFALILTEKLNFSVILLII